VRGPNTFRLSSYQDSYKLFMQNPVVFIDFPKLGIDFESKKVYSDTMH